MHLQAFTAPSFPVRAMRAAIVLSTFTCYRSDYALAITTAIYSPMATWPLAHATHAATTATSPVCTTGDRVPHCSSANQAPYDPICLA